MSKAFIGVLLPLWPFYVAFLLYAEFCSYCYANRPSARVQIVGYTVWLVAALIGLYATSATANTPQFYTFAYVLVAAWTVAVPLGAINLGSRFLAGRGAPLLRQVGLVVLAGVVFVCWPLFGLASFCMSGVDCV